MSEIRRLLHQAARQAVATEGEPGTLGLADGTLYYTDALAAVHYDRVWVTMSDSSEVVAVCTAVPHQWGLPVYVGARSGVPTVLRTDWAQAQRFTGGRPVGAGQHAWLHNRLGPDALFLGGLQVPILVQPTSPVSMAVHVPDIYYVYDGTRKHFAAADSASLSAYVPSSVVVQHFAVLCLDRENNALAVVDGDDSAPGSAYSPDTRAFVPFDAADVAGVTIPAAYWPLVAIRFYNGQTAVQVPDIWLDAQPRGGEHLGGDVGGPASSTDNAIVRFDGAGGDVLQDSAVTIEDAGTVVLYNSATRGVLNVTERSAEPSSPSAGDIYLDDGTNTTSGAPGLRHYNGSAWEDISGGGGGGASAFTDLSDVPSSYSGEGGKVVAVKDAEDGLEFVAGGMVNPMTMQDDLIVGVSFLTNFATPAEGASVTVKDTWSTFVASNIIDSNDLTYWASNSKVSNTPWFKIDLGAARTVKGHRLYDDTSSNHQATQYKVEYSTNDADWTLIYTSPTGRGGDTGEVSHSTDVSARYWRFTALAGSGSVGWNVFTGEVLGGDSSSAAARLGIGDLYEVLKCKGDGTLGYATTLPVSTDDVDNPPTSAQLTSAFGSPADRGAGFMALVDDAGAHAAEYLVWSDGTNWWSMAGAVREVLSADRTYYVRTDGSDSNDGLTNSAGGAFLTIQRAVDVCAETLDFGGYTVTIQVGDGTYTDPVVLKAMVGMAGPDSLVINGNSTTPSNVVISTTSAHAISLDGPTVMGHVKYLKMQTTTSGMCCNVVNKATLLLSGVNFGTCANYHVLMNGAARLQIKAGTGYTISGGATFHFYVGAKCTVQSESVGTVTLSGTPGFVNFAYVEDGNLRINGNTYSGSATGSRYSVVLNGVIFTNGAGATYLPGDSAGSTATGGQYA